MRVKYMGSKSWLAPHVDRLLGDVAVLHSPFFGSGKLEHYLATRRPALKVFFRHTLEDFSAVSQTVRICKFSGERQRNTRPANLKELTV